MSWAKVGGTSGNGSNVSTFTVTYTGATAGNLLVVMLSAFMNSTTTPGAATDTNGTVSTAILPTPKADGSGNSQLAAIFYVKNCNSGSHTFTLKMSGTVNDGHATVTEFSGGDTVTAIDQTASAGATTAQTVTSGTTAALAAATDLAVVCVGVESGTGVANAAITDPPAGYTSLAVGNNTSSDIAFEHAFKFLASATGQSVTWSWTDASTKASQGAIATFLIASGGGGAVQQNLMLMGMGN